MADLTAPLDAEKPELFVPHGPKEPIDRSGGIWQGLLGAGGKVVDMLAVGQKDAGINEAAPQVAATMAQANNGLPPEVQTGADRLAKVQKAQDQGSLPAGSIDMHLQDIMSTTMSKYPHQAAQIAEFFHRQGYDSLMYQNVFNQQRAQNTMAEAKVTEQTENWKAGSLYAMPDWTDAQTETYGAQVRLNSAKMQAAKDASEASAAAATANKDNYTANKAQSDDQMRGALLDQWTLHSTPVLDHFNKMAMSDPDGLAKHPEELTNATAFFEAQREQLHAAGTHLDPSVMKTIDERIDQAEKGFKDFYTDYSAGKQRVLENMKTTFGIEGAEAFPIYSQLKSLLGENYINQVFGGVGPTLPKSMIDGMRAEFSGYGSMTSSQGMVAVNAVGAMLKGNLHLQDVPQDQIKNVVSGAIVGVHAHTADINTGNLGNPQTVGQFTNSLGTLVDAAFSIQPQGNPDINTIHTASQTLSDPRVVAAARKLANNPSTAEQGQGLLLGMRAANQHLLLAAKNANTQTSVSFAGQPGGTTFVERGMSQTVPEAPAYNAKVAFNPKTGYWDIQSKGPVPGFQLDPLTKQAKVLNDAVNVLVNTTGDDKNFPQGATPISLRKFYAGEAGPEGLVNAKGQSVIPAKKPEDTFENRIGAEQTALKAATAQTLKETEQMQTNLKEATKPLSEVYDPKNPASQKAVELISVTAPKYAEIAGMDPADFTALAKGLAAQESAMGTAGPSPTGVKGIMQVTKDTAKSYGLDRDNLEQGIEAGTHYLADLIHRFKGNLAVALTHYNGGGDPQYAAKVLNFYHQFKQEGIS